MTSTENICSICKQTITPLPYPHTQRKCAECGKTIYAMEPGENGVGIKVQEGATFVIPNGFLRLSLKRELATGKFYRPGITWFVQMLFMADQANNPDEVIKMLDVYEADTDAVLKSSPSLEGFDLDDPIDAEKAWKVLKQQQDTPAWWAAIAGSMGRIVKESIESNDAQRAVWAMATQSNARAMMIFKRDLEEVVWKGYLVDDFRKTLDIWNANQDNEDEEFWQHTLSANSFVLSQIFAFPMLILKGKAYLGGKGIENSGGNVLDFLIGNAITSNIGLVEIKTPTTKLLTNKEYRSGVYSPSGELSGAVQQVLHYRDTITKDYYGISGRSKTDFEVFAPQCVVLAGNYKQEIEGDDRKRSFELYRSGLRDVQIMTYDELFEKVGQILSVLQGTP